MPPDLNQHDFTVVQDGNKYRDHRTRRVLHKVQCKNCGMICVIDMLYIKAPEGLETCDLWRVHQVMEQ